ncbi:alpha/beta hydrolase [Halobaculum lipolyticum]|uniref:Alpha/beta hydrolase n=1 Tax=Halobaculum lipolyticum TaxID=3032001 RepID=A0ABD5WDM2_9EURY|nr:alpha/beta hydrolase [Halobaculum sp. DT31]
MYQTGEERYEQIEFASEGTPCAASLYRPDESQTTGDPPIVVMGNGFGLPRGAGLPAVARRLTEHGLAAMTFDYRSLGQSGGEPRNVLLPSRQIDDWRAAVGHARTLDGIDGDRVGVWGFSLGGGGAFVTAAREDVDAYVGQNPVLDGTRTLLYIARQMGPTYGLRTTAAGVRDLARKWTGREPNYIPIWGTYPDDLPALPTPGSKEGHEAVVGPDADDPSVNRCAARTFLTFGLYRPVSKARRVDCPALLVEGARDQIAPRSAIEAAAERLPEVTWITYDIDHFGAFVGETAGEIVEKEAAFLERHLVEDTGSGNQ